MTVRVGKFEKVSIEQFSSDYKEGDNDTKCEILNKVIKLPTRATKGSAGYDIVTPFEINLKPGEYIKVPTGLKCQVDNGWFLGIFPKSGLGFKYNTRLGNSVGIIDEDYYNNVTNEGHIWVKVGNDGDKELTISKGKAFCQGLFLPYGITYDDVTDAEREGGLGSTNA